MPEQKIITYVDAVEIEKILSITIEPICDYLSHNLNGLFNVSDLKKVNYKKNLWQLLTQDRNAGERDREVSWIDRPRQQRIPSSSENFGIY